MPVIEKVIFHTNILLFTHNFKKIYNKRKSEKKKNLLVFKMAEKPLLESQSIIAGKGSASVSHPCEILTNPRSVVCPVLLTFPGASAFFSGQQLLQ